MSIANEWLPVEDLGCAILGEVDRHILGFHPLRKKFDENHEDQLRKSKETILDRWTSTSNEGVQPDDGPIWCRSTSTETHGNASVNREEQTSVVTLH